PGGAPIAGPARPLSSCSSAPSSPEQSPGLNGGTVRSNEQEAAVSASEDLRFAGLETLTARLAAGTVSSTRLVDDALARIEATQPTLNAFRRVRTAAARTE